MWPCPILLLARPILLLARPGRFPVPWPLPDPTPTRPAPFAAPQEHRMQLGSKPIFHLEAFVAKFMSVYKQFLIEISG